MDGLRGFAALFVAIGHCATAVNGTSFTKITIDNFKSASTNDKFFRIIHIVFNADAAVVLFFVLSGLVLTRSLAHKSDPAAEAIPYVIKRAFRLLPVSIVSSLPLALLTSAVATQLVGTALIYDHSINGVLWSLQVEVLGSILVYIAWVGRIVWPPAVFSMLVASAFAAFFMPHYLIIFLPCFLLGAAIDKIDRRMFNYALLPSVLLLTSADFIFADYPMMVRAAQFGAAFLLVGSVANSNSAALSSTIPRFLGRTSYPFYLLHLSAALFSLRLLSAFGYSFSNHAQAEAWLVYCALSVSVALFVSYLINKMIECPFNEFGHRLASVARPKIGQSSVSARG